MSQTNAIILRIKADRADEFERLFKEHQYPKAWDEMAEEFQPEGPSVWGGRTIYEVG